MTVQADFNKVIYTSDGVTLSYEFNFVTYQESWISVLDPDVTVLEFEVILNSNQDNNPGGFVNFTVEPPPSGQEFVILRTAPLEQLLDYTSYDDFPAASHERGLDQGIIIAQQQQEEIDRSYKAPIGSDPGADFTFPPYDAGKLLGWSETEANKVDNAPYSFADIQAEADKALVSAINAEASEVLAQQWAAQQEDIPVDGQLYSARHYAIKALKARSGLNLVAIISGDDLCPKPGDGPGDCTAPDYRNPGERFPNRENLPGDYFIISAPGSMNLKDPQNPTGPNVVTLVEVSDYIIYFPEVQNGDGTVILGEGWYKQGGLTGDGTAAALISFDDTTTVAKGTNVQAFNEALDFLVQGAQAKADSSVQLTGDQTIADQKTFTTNPQSNAAQAGAGQALTRKDYVDAADTANATAAADANTNANTRKLEADFLRTGTRLDINNVRTS